MPELQSCANLLHASALCARNRGCSLEYSALPAPPLDCEAQEPVNVVAELSAALQRERQKNAELMEKISLLEAQIQERGNASLPIPEQQEVLPIARDRTFKKFKRHKTEPKSDEVKDAEIVQSVDLAPETKHDNLCMTLGDTNQEDRLVNWMTMDDTQYLNLEKCKDGDPAADCDDTDDSEDDDDDEYCDEDDTEFDENDGINDENLQVPDPTKKHAYAVVDVEMQTQYLGKFPTVKNELTVVNMIQEINRGQNKGILLLDTISNTNKKEMKKHRRKESKMTCGYKELLETHIHGKETGHKGSGSISSHKKPPKVPLCPKEVKRIIGSEVLLLKNAQSHTIRKLIVFASLGIRHGCEDMYELDFNHFNVLQKGELYVSPNNPGEHVLYEHPGVRRKVFYPNRQNPTLCPVQILEEEKAMRPSDPCCPSCLLLCIKYGGRTRNLPQNEYVRQRMGRNKLKSFGPIMCKMAMLVHIRSGSFFFKALGITLLFMAGFPDELVQRETKYRNLDLLKKYYRKDEDAAGDELFHLFSIPCDIASPSTQQLAVKPTKLSGKKKIGLANRPQNIANSSVVPSTPSSSVPPTQFGLMGYASVQTHAMAAFQSMPSHTVTDTLITNPSIATSSSNIPYHTGHIPTPYSVFPPHPPNTFMPMVYWPHLNPFPSCPYPTSYGYRSFPPPGSYISLHPQPYYGPPSYAPLMPKVVEESEKKCTAIGEANSDSDSSSSSTKSKKLRTS